VLKWKIEVRLGEGTEGLDKFIAMGFATLRLRL